jgi:glycosyltransferase involved in cell wall biosynthesis
VDELLQSLTKQSFADFEVLLVEDGSTITSQPVFEKYSSVLSIRYFIKPNSGPGPSRNFGFERARGDYFVVFDSDCVIPPHYFEVVEKDLAEYKWDAWGGPDRGHENFTLLQRAMAFTMSSVVTTGGIRGGKKHVGRFQPRSFNMGLSRAIFEKTKGFQFDRFAEDIELSIRMHKAGFKVGLITDAYVFHKRRATLSQFFKQVSNFGKGRVLVGNAHRGEVKLAHWAPAIFLLGLLFLAIVSVFSVNLGLMLLSGYALFVVLLFVDAVITTRSMAVSLLSVPAAFVQLTGYGYGFLKEKLKTYI